MAKPALFRNKKDSTLPPPNPSHCWTGRLSITGNPETSPQFLSVIAFDKMLIARLSTFRRKSHGNEVAFVTRSSWRTYVYVLLFCSLSLVRWNASWEIASNAIVFGHTRRPYGTNNREEAFPFKEKVFVELKSVKLLFLNSVEGDNMVFDRSP